MTPGSSYAISCGCLCDQLQNNHGVGAVIGTRRIFAVDDACIVHGSFKWMHPSATYAQVTMADNLAPPIEGVIVFAVSE